MIMIIKHYTKRVLQQTYTPILTLKKEASHIDKNGVKCTYL